MISEHATSKGNTEVHTFVVSDDDKLEVLHRLHSIDQAAQWRR